ncbi:NprX family peptide pheromone [Bacillus manliponensis]|nr:NprX family peptide pheromone [Bacillus manliponensis]
MKKAAKIVILTGFVFGLVLAGQYSNKPDYYGQSSPVSEKVNV